MPVLVGLIHGTLDELGEGERAEQRPGPPREPLVHADERPVVLLHLLLARGKRGHKTLREVPLDGHTSADCIRTEGPQPGSRPSPWPMEPAAVALGRVSAWIAPLERHPREHRAARIPAGLVAAAEELVGETLGPGDRIDTRLHAAVASRRRTHIAPQLQPRTMDQTQSPSTPLTAVRIRV